MDKRIVAIEPSGLRRIVGCLPTETLNQPPVRLDPHYWLTRVCPRYVAYRVLPTLPPREASHGMP